MYKYIGLVPPLQGVGTPSYEKSWIRPWLMHSLKQSGKFSCQNLLVHPNSMLGDSTKFHAFHLKVGYDPPPPPPKWKFQLRT